MFYSPIAEVERDVRLYEILPAPVRSSLGAADRRTVDQTVTFAWAREVHAQIVFVHGGRVLKEGSTLTDYGHFLSSIPEAIEEAKNACEAYEVTPSSTLRVEVRVIIKEHPCLPERRLNGLSPHWRSIAGKVYREDPYDTDGKWRDKPGLRLEPRTLVDHKTCWSSTAPEDTSEYEAIKALYQLVFDENLWRELGGTIEDR